MSSRTRRPPTPSIPPTRTPRTKPQCNATANPAGRPGRASSRPTSTTTPNSNAFSRPQSIPLTAAASSRSPSSSPPPCGAASSTPSPSASAEPSSTPTISNCTPTCRFCESSLLNLKLRALDPTDDHDADPEGLPTRSRPNPHTSPRRPRRTRGGPWWGAVDAGVSSSVVVRHRVQ